jgi:peptidoglycan/LPS O-acetylase OafA/YrhL
MGGVLILSIVLNAIIAYLWTIKMKSSPGFLFSYVNPVVVIGALCAVSYFSKLRINPNRFINWVAASAFAAYLTHGNPNIGTPYFKPLIQRLYNSYSGLSSIIAIFLAIVIIFAISILLDQPRKWCWRIINKYIPNYKI